MKKLNLDNVHFEEPLLSSIPPTTRDKENMKERHEMLERKRKEGKQIVQVCCSKTQKVLEGALEIGISQGDFDLFVQVFKQHPLTTFDFKKFSSEGEQIYAQKLIDEIFQTADLIEDGQLREYFLTATYDEAQRHNGQPWKLITLRHFNKAFKAKRSERRIELSEQVGKYTFSIPDRVRWFEDKTDPFKIKGNIEEIIHGIEGGRNGTIAGSQDENGEGYVIPKFKTVEERERYAIVEKEHKILSQIHIRLQQIAEENQKLIASTGIEAFERIQKGIIAIKAEILNCWNQLHPETKKEFADSEISGILNTMLLESTESNKPTNEQKIKVRETLNFLGESHQNEGQLLTKVEFERLINYMVQMFDTKQVPENIEPINPQYPPAEIIRYAFYSLHCQFSGKGKKLKYPYVEFLKTVFPQKFEGWENETLKKKLSAKPDSWDYWSGNQR